MMFRRLPTVFTRLNGRFLSTEASVGTSTKTSSSVKPEDVSSAPQGQLSELTSEEFYEEIHTEALKLTPSQERDLDNSLKQAMLKNKEVADFLKDYTVDLPNKKIRDTTGAKTIGTDTQYPRLERSDKHEPYTSQELYLRREFLEKNASRLGSQLRDVYIPHLEVSRPQGVEKMSIAKLLAAGAHLGHSKSLYRSSNQQFIYGEYKGIHIIDLEKTLVYLKKACRVVEEVALKGGVILFVGSSPYERVLEKSASRCGGYYISTKWTAGTLTNATEISSKWARVEVDMGDRPTGRQLTAQEQRSIVKPDLIVVLNPTENRVLLHEAAQTRVPTVGIIDTDSESSLVTYPIPANDSSRRSVTLLCGVLSKSGEKGYNTRLTQFAQYRAANESNVDSSL